MSKRPEIPQTKRSTYRPMNQMNGDFLGQLKRPLCSELSPEMRGTNKGKEANCKFKVSLWFKDKEYNMRKINRSEDSVYDSFLRTHKEKRRLRREAYKRQQLQARESAELARENALANVDRLVLPDIVQATVKPQTEVSSEPKNNTADSQPVVVVDSLQDNTSSVLDNVVENRDGFSSAPEDSINTPTGNLLTTTGEPPRNKTPTIVTSKVLLVSKSNPQKPVVSERSDSFIMDENHVVKTNKDDHTVEDTATIKENVDNNNCKVKKTKKKKSKTKVQTNEEMSEVNDNQNNNKCTKPIEKHLSEMELIHKVSMKQNRRNFTNNMPVISELGQADMTLSYQKAWQSHPSSPDFLDQILHSNVKNPPSNDESPPRASPLEKFQSKSLDIFDSYNSKVESSCSEPPPVSMIVLNRRRSKERDRMRKRILNSEPLIVYMKAQNGDIIPSITGFKRKTFDPPSNKERYFQKKLLQSQKHAIESQENKIEQFYQKLDIDKDKANEFHRYRQVRPSSADEKVKKELPSLGVSLEQMAAVFNRRHEPLPHEVDPQSIAAMQFCQYLRSHDFDQPRKTKKTSKSQQVY